MASKKRRMAEDDLPDHVSDSEDDDNMSQEGESTETDGLSAKSIGLKAGEIEKIRLQNFMCHENLEVPFRSNTNFIVGANGSGKSAVLTALQVCLGAKASTTNRGSKASELIKTGKSSAIIEVTLRNEGTDAYRPDIFGDRIIIERKIDKASTHIKIKGTRGGGRGQIHGSKKKDLQDLLNHFNILADNPCIIVTQDTSRSFLPNATDSQKYKFFMIVTQLEAMREEIKGASDNIAASDHRLKSNQEKLEAEKTTVLRLKKEHDDAEFIQGIDKQISSLHIEQAWALFNDSENALNECKSKEEQMKRQRTAIDQKIQELQTIIDQQSAEQDDVQKRIKELTDQLTEIADRIRTDEKAIAQHRAICNEHQQSMRQCDTSIRNAERAKAGLKAKMDQLLEHANRDIRKEIEDKNRKIEDRTHKIQKLREGEATYNSEKQKYEAVSTSAGQKVHELNGKVATQRSQHDKVKKHLSQLKATREDKVKQYGAQMPNLLKSIQYTVAAGQFSSPPIGPIGLLLQLKDPSFSRFSAAVEQACQSVFSSFIVSNNADRKMLENLWARSGLSPGHLSVIIQRHRRESYDVSAFKPSAEHLTIEDVLQLDVATVQSLPIRYDMEVLNATIFNTLRDQRSIESTVLKDTFDEAKELAFVRRERNVGEVWTKDCTSLRLRGGSEMSKTHPSDNRSWGVNVDHAITEAEARLRDIVAEIETVNAEQRAIQEEFKGADNQLQRIRASLSSTQREIRRLEAELEELRVPTNETPVDVTEFQDGMAEKDREISEIQARKTELAQKLAEEKEKIAPIEKEKQAKEVEKRRLDAEISDVQSSVQGRLMQVSTSARKKETLVQKLAETDRMLVTIQAEIKQREELCENRHASAQKVIQSHENSFGGEVSRERMATRRTTSEIDAEIRQLSIKKTTQEQRMGSRSFQEIKKSYLDAKTAYETHAESLKRFSRDVELMQQGLNMRWHAWKRIRKQYTAEVVHRFNQFLGVRGHSGSLSFDTEKETCSMSVTLNKEMANSKAVEDAKSLSGGERSFSTIAFLLALWQCVDSPFCANDEFDIFMDAVYRKKSVDLLLHNAQKDERQFIFLTPHDTSVIQRGPRVHIVKMPTPRPENQRSMEEFTTGAGSSSSS